LVTPAIALYVGVDFNASVIAGVNEAFRGAGALVSMFVAVPSQFNSFGLVQKHLK
jgi:hypothetical protein